ncbi:rCG52231 [Rattus norvegicus]|uniref:RCG52231 n=1 Tax=Rattus norvegicus TaxID=10116 RepID=A6K6E3_RAT|nr:rCG52231 [Rattus norvegicus]
MMPEQVTPTMGENTIWMRRKQEENCHRELKGLIAKKWSQ